MPALYDLTVLQTLIGTGDWDYLNERSDRQWLGHAKKTLEKLEWDEADLVEVLRELTPEDWQKTVPDCAIHNLPGVEFIDADQYEIHWDEYENCRRGVWTGNCTSLSLKLALVRDASGEYAGLVTLHLSGIK